MTRAWQEQRRNWRELELRDAQDAEIHGDKVYSPPADTREGKERKERRGQIEKAGKLTERWDMMRECKRFLEENSEKWERRTSQEGKKNREGGEADKAGNGREEEEEVWQGWKQEAEC